MIRNIVILNVKPFWRGVFVGVLALNTIYTASFLIGHYWR